MSLLDKKLTWSQQFLCNTSTAIALIILNGCKGDDDLRERMIRVCQDDFQRRVERIENGDQNWPSKSALTILFLLGFSDLHMDAVDASEVETHKSNSDVCLSNTLSSRSPRIVNVSLRTWKATTNLAPQDT